MVRKTQVTLKDVANACGISTSAVSRILQLDDNRYNVETRKLVHETARKLNYRPNSLAQAVRTGKTGIVGILLLNRGESESGTWPPELLAACNAELLHAGYQVLFGQIDLEAASHQELPKMVSSGLVEGILSYSFIAETNYLDTLQEVVPFVVSIEDKFKNTPCVIFDEYQAGAVIAQHFFECGYKNTVVVNSTDGAERHNQRIAGFTDTLRQLWGNSNLPVPIFYDYGWSDHAGRDAAREILQMRPLPEAVFGINDYFAWHVAQEFQANGIVIPEMIAVAGVGGQFFPKLDLGLTSALLDKAGLGKVAAQKMEHLLSNRSCEIITQFPVTLAQGKTTKVKLKH